MNFSVRTSRFLLVGVLLLALALRLPGWFTQDEKSRFRLFEPDEYQHVQIAVYQVQCLDDSLLTDWDVVRKIFNARGYGIQLGTLGWLCHRLAGMELSTTNFILLGRMLSTTYALLLMLLVYGLGRRLFPDRSAALMATLLLAICDLNVIYSHYALPAVGYVFWSYAFLFTAMQLMKKLELLAAGGAINVWRDLLLLAFTASAVFAFKFDFIPFFVAGVVLIAWPLYLKVEVKKILLWVPNFIILFILGFACFTSFNFSLERIQYSISDLHRQNYDVIPQDDHWIFNPIVYGIALIAGTSMVQFIFAVRGGSVLWKRKQVHWSIIALVVIFLVLEFGVRWSSDVPFVRRANIFMPALALLAAYGWSELKPKFRTTMGILLVGYTLGLCLVSQSNAWWDTRYAARAYLLQEHAGERIKYGSYSHAVGMPPGVTLQEEEDILVIHEAAYGRNWRSFTTPFRIPKCCEEVYHCGEEDCRFIQRILRHEDEEYNIIRHFRTREWFPERILFKRYLGNFETFLGDVLILRKQK